MIIVTEIILNSNASVQLEAIRKKWYDNKRKKHIPSDLKLTPDILLYWYIDDGNLANKSVITLYTNAFTKDEVSMLSKKVYEATGITFYVKDKLIRGKIYPILICSKFANIQTFFNYLEKSNNQSLLLAKKIFPWKFDPSIKKFEHLRSIQDTDPVIRKYLAVKDSNKNHINI